MRRATNGSRRSPMPAAESGPTQTRGARNPAARTSARAPSNEGPPADAEPASSDPLDAVDEPGDQRLGPYERRYDVRRGYGIERTVVRP